MTLGWSDVRPRACVLMVLSVSIHVIANAAPDAQISRARHSVDCVAALRTDTDSLAKEVKAGRQELKSVLLAHLEEGAAFIGDSYLGGSRDEKQSKTMLEAATEAQKSLPPQELAGLQLSCSKEGGELLAATNAINRVVIKRIAKNRMERLLEPAGA